MTGVFVCTCQRKKDGSTWAQKVVKSLPDGFALLARSETSRIATMKHPGRPLYGVQFHPERFTKEHPEGDAVVGNFLRNLR